jgi:hypothetical protein
LAKPVTAEKLHLSLQEILKSPRYAEYAKTIQKVLRKSGGFQQATEVRRSA